MPAYGWIGPPVFTVTVTLTAWLVPLSGPAMRSRGGKSITVATMFDMSAGVGIRELRQDLSKYVGRVVVYLDASALLGG